MGRIGKFYKEVCLVEQEYVRDSSLSVKQVIAECEKALGAKITVDKFVRYEMGEGLQKKEENLADEVQAKVAAMKK